MLIASMANGATRTWTGTANGLWSIPANWGGATPSAGDDLVFPAGAQNLSMTNDLPAGTIMGSLSITGDGYSLGGNQLGLGGDVLINAPTTGPVFSLPLVLTKSVAITNSAAAVTATFSPAATIAVGSFVLNVSGAGKTSIAGTITGSGSLFRGPGIGDLVLSGDNTFTGAVTVDAGSITVQSASALGDAATGTTVQGTGALRVMGTGPMTVTEPLVLGSSANTVLVNLLGTTTWSGPITMNVDSRVAANTPLTITGVVSGASRLSVLGFGGITLTGANTYSGGTTIESGTLTVAGPASLGAGSIATWLQARLIVGNGTYTNELSLQGSTFPKGGLESLSGTTTWSGPITMVSPDSALETAGTLIVSGGIGGAGGLVKRGDGELTITSSSTYASGTDVAAGTLRCASVDAIPDASAVSVEGTLALEPGGAEVIGSLTGSGTVTLPAGSKLTTGGNNATTAWDGVISGAGSVTFTGTGSKYLSGSNTYAGATSVEAGSLLVRGSLVSTSTVKTGARMGVANAASVGPMLATGGTIAPGYAPPRGASTQALVLDTASKFEVALYGTIADDYSHLFVAGTTALGDATLNVSGFTPAVGDAFVIIHADSADPVSGHFKGLPEGAVFSANGSFFRISYTGGDGNDVVLTTILEPPPDAGVVPPDGGVAAPDGGGGSPDAGGDVERDASAELDGSAESTGDDGGTRSPDASTGDGAQAANDVPLGLSTGGGGCDCRTAAPGMGPSHALGVLAAVAGAWLARRRRPRAKSLSQSEHAAQAVAGQRPARHREVREERSRLL